MRRSAWATRLVFLAVGVAGAAWAALIPFVRVRAGLDDGALGLLLLGLGAGSIAAMPVAGALAPRVGCRALIVGALLVVASMLPLLAGLSSPPLLALALLVFGAGFGTVDVAMNMQAIIVERGSGRVMMSGFHALFSLGGIVGACAMAGLLALGASPLLAGAIAAAALLALLAGSAGALLPYGSAREGPAFAVPRGIVLLLGVLCFVAFLAEGAVLDWGAVFLATQRGVPAVYGGLGYAAFSATMTVGRFTGDRVVARFGGRAVVACSGVLAAAGFGSMIAVPFWPVAVAGYALVGAGCANIVPVLFTAVGRQRLMPESQALPAVTTLGYAGILAGPAAIGFIAHAASLSTAFVLVALMLLGVAAAARGLDVSAPPPPR